MNINLTINDRKLDFDLDIDLEFFADSNLVRMFQAGMVPEPELLSLLFHVLREGDVAIDAGANIGLFTMIMSQLVGPTGRVLAFEPSNDNFQKLLRNADVNGFNNITAFEHALWNKKETLDFYGGVDSGWNSLVKKDDHDRQYKVSTWMLDDLNPATPRLIKLDCEGSELNILQGGERMLRRGVKYVVCELSNDHLKSFATTQRKLRGFMYDLGYDTWLLREDGMLPVYVPYDTALMSRRFNMNVLFATMRTVTELWNVVDADTYLGVAV